MTDKQTLTVSSEVEVAVDPITAFNAFTDEMDLWWERGYINFWSDGSRVVEVRCESGTGGRIIEVLDDATGDEVFVRGRITQWEPGVRLAWNTDFDDVLTEVRFEPVAGGTRVVVEHTVPVGGRDAGGTAWSRVVPGWFGSWIARRAHDKRESAELARLSLVVSYERPLAAMRWLHETFGLGGSDGVPVSDADEGHQWIEFRVGDVAVMLGQLEGPRAAPAGFEPWVYVDDLESHLDRARARGATIVSGIEEYPHSHYVAEDLEGNRWRFLQARATMG